MLRDEKLLSRKLTAGMRAGLVAVLASASLAVAGLRGAAADRRSADDRAVVLADDGQPKDSQNAARAKSGGSSGTSSTSGTSGSSSTTAGEAAEPFSLGWVPRDAVVVGALRPRELLSRPALAPLRKSLVEQKELQESLGISPERIEQVVVVAFLELGQRGEPMMTDPNLIVRLAAADDAETFIKTMQPNPEKGDYSGQSYIKGQGGAGPLCFQPDERTVVVCRREEHLRRMIVAGKAGAAKARWAEAWKSAATADAAVFVNTAAVGGALQAELQGRPDELTKFGMFAPLWQSTTSAVVSANFRNQLALSLNVSAQSPKEAVRVKDTIAAVVTLGQNSLSQAREMASRQPGAEGAVVLRALDTADTLLDSVKISQVGDQVQAAGGGDAEDAATLVGMLLPAITQARSAARRAQSMNNLKQLALAMHNYADANKSFPPAVLYGPDGKTPYSWRVALLSYLDQEPLYRQYKFDEPWDSETNKQVLAKMPAVFRDPNDPPDSTFSSYYGLVGPSTIFSGKEGVKISQITDGTSNTLMFVEAKRDIPWTKPEDIPYAADRLPGNARSGAGGAVAGVGGKSLKDVTEGAAGAIGGPYATDKPLPKLGGRYDGIFLAALCDGSVRSIFQKLDEKTLRALITRDGGEAVNINDPPGTAPGGRPATPLPTPPKRGN